MPVGNFTNVSAAKQRRQAILSAALFPSHTVIFNNGGSPPSITKCDGRMLKKRDELRPILGPALCGQVEPDPAEMAAEFVSGTRPHTAGPQMA